MKSLRTKSIFLMAGLLGAAAGASALGGVGLPGVSTRASRGFQYAYPESSSRQAMRAHRRQQGGKGIALGDDFKYHAIVS